MTEQFITDSNFLLIAMHHYDNSQCTSIAEFEEDLKRFAYLKKLFGRYKDNADLKERLILNHITVLHNLFGVVTLELLFFKIDKQYWDVLATFLVYLELMPAEIPEFGIKLSDLNLDQHVLATLRNL
jgi:hypothetical protein